MWEKIRTFLSGAERGDGPVREEVLQLSGRDPMRLLWLPGDAALACWLALREEFGRSGAYPVMLGDREDLADLIERARVFSPTGPSALLSAAAACAPETWLAAQTAAFPDVAFAEGPWPESPDPTMVFLTPLSAVDGRPKPEVAIALVPAREPAELLAYLAFGGWNECPAPDVHVALWRRWQAQYGAEIVAVTRDVIEARVANPPRARAEALALAREHFVYCEDVVSQGFESLEALAATLLEGETWFFWWD